MTSESTGSTRQRIARASAGVTTLKNALGLLVVCIP